MNWGIVIIEMIYFKLYVKIVVVKKLRIDLEIKIVLFLVILEFKFL